MFPISSFRVDLTLATIVNFPFGCLIFKRDSKKFVYSFSGLIRNRCKLEAKVKHRQSHGDPKVIHIKEFMGVF